MSEAIQIYKTIAEMRKNLALKWRDYKSLSLQGGRMDSNTLELKQAEDRICERIQKEIAKMFPDELDRVIKESGNG